MKEEFKRRILTKENTAIITVPALRKQQKQQLITVGKLSMLSVILTADLFLKKNTRYSRRI